MTTNACCVYDFTIGADFTDQIALKKILNKNCKKWTFQLEEGETGYVHYQGRFSLKVKKRLTTAVKLFPKEIHLSVTSKENSNNDYYVSKEETRISGPWSDTDMELYIPRQYRGLIDDLRPFQKSIWDSADDFNPRSINCIIDTRGNIGKSVICALCELHNRGIDIPPVNDSEKIIQSVCNILMGRQLRIPKIIFLDIPRSVKQEALYGMFTAIEQIKKGKVYDFRYKYQEWWFDSPQVWVFMNIKPETGYLSRDRWQFWEINSTFELTKFEAVEDL